MTYKVCPDCRREISEGRIYKCEIEGCPHSVCLDCVNMVAGMNICNNCYAKDYVGYQRNE